MDDLMENRIEQLNTTVIDPKLPQELSRSWKREQ